MGAPSIIKINNYFIIIRMQTSQNQYQLVELYDNAFHIELPLTLRDMADFVPIPDSQFVF